MISKFGVMDWIHISSTDQDKADLSRSVTGLAVSQLPIGML
jgi:hypothetical protein